MTGTSAAPPPRSTARTPRGLRRGVAAVLLLATFTGCAGQGQDMTDRAAFGNSANAPLAQAASAGDIARARQLIHDGANVDAVDDRGRPLLVWAVRERDRTAFRTLLELGADPARGDRDGRTALHAAAMETDDSWMDALLARGTSPDLPNTVTGAPPLFDALRARLDANVARLLKAGARLDVTDRSGTTPLIQAALVNDAGSALEFLEAGADPRATDRTGATFQDYLFKSDPKLLNAATKRDHDGIRALLRAKGVAVQSD